MTMTATNHDDQFGGIYPIMLKELNCTFGISVSRLHCCGYHGGRRCVSPLYNSKLSIDVLVQLESAEANGSTSEQADTEMGCENGGPSNGRKGDPVDDDSDAKNGSYDDSPVPGTSKSSGARRRKEPKRSSPDPVEGDLIAVHFHLHLWSVAVDRIFCRIHRIYTMNLLHYFKTSVAGKTCINTGRVGRMYDVWKQAILVYHNCWLTDPVS